MQLAILCGRSNHHQSSRKRLPHQDVISMSRVDLSPSRYWSRCTILAFDIHCYLSSGETTCHKQLSIDVLYLVGCTDLVVSFRELRTSEEDTLLWEERRSDGLSHVHTKAFERVNIREMSHLLKLIGERRGPSQLRLHLLCLGKRNIQSTACNIFWSNLTGLQDIKFQFLETGAF